MFTYKQIIRFPSFLGIGILASLLDFVVYELCVVHWGIYPSIASLLSFSCSSLFNFYGNALITFKSSSSSRITALSRFYLIVLGGLILQFMLLSVFLTWGIQHTLAKLMVMGCIALYNFIFHTGYTFHV